MALGQRLDNTNRRKPIGADSHAAIIVALEIGDSPQKGDGVVTSVEAFGLPSGSDPALSDLMALKGSSGMVDLPVAKSSAIPMLSAILFRMRATRPAHLAALMAAQAAAELEELRGEPVKIEAATMRRVRMPKSMRKLEPWPTFWFR